MQQDEIILERQGAVAILTLNRPATGNAIDVPMAQALHAAADTLHGDASVRAILLRSSGSLFSGGGDIRGMADAVANGAAAASSHMHALVTALHAALLRLLSVDAPIVAAVQGPAAGAGMSLVLAADLSYLAPRAKLVPAYVGIGLCGDGGATWMLPRLCGVRRATELLMFNTPITPDRAVALGLATAALAEEGEAFDAAVLAKAQQIAAGPRRALSALRQLLRESADASFTEQLSREAAAMTALACGDDFREGLAALAAKRPAVFP